MAQQKNSEGAPVENAASVANEAAPKVNWVNSGMKTTYSNVCNVSSTREEVSLMFGTNQTFNAVQDGIVIELTDRIILNPYAAKRLALVLTGVIKQYETSFGELAIEA